MLDLEVVTAPTVTALDVVTLAEMKRHLRITHSKMDEVITDAIKEAVDVLDFRDGILNRTVLPRTLRRWLRNYPTGVCAADRAIQLPFGPVTGTPVVKTTTGAVVISSSTYITSGALVPVIIPNDVWPTIPAGGRAVSIEYTAGYSAFPAGIKRMVKILAAHFIENPEATINEPRQMMINRKVEFGIDFELNRFRVPISYDDWLE